jgi:hypothetical protein
MNNGDGKDARSYVTHLCCLADLTQGWECGLFTESLMQLKIDLLPRLEIQRFKGKVLTFFPSSNRNREEKKDEEGNYISHFPHIKN